MFGRDFLLSSAVSCRERGSGDYQHHVEKTSMYLACVYMLVTHDKSRESGILASGRLADQVLHQNSAQL